MERYPLNHNSFGIFNRILAVVKIFAKNLGTILTINWSDDFQSENKVACPKLITTSNSIWIDQRLLFTYVPKVVSVSSLSDEAFGDNLIQRLMIRFILIS